MRSILLSTATMIFLAMSADAQDIPPNCASTEGIKRVLEELGQTVQAYALTAKGELMQMFANVDTGEWIVTTTHPASPMISCVEMGGDNFTLNPTDSIPMGEDM